MFMMLSYWCETRLDFRLSLVSGLPSLRSFRRRRVGSFPEQQLVIEPGVELERVYMYIPLLSKRLRSDEELTLETS